MDRNGKLSETFSEIFEARDRIDNFVLSAFAEPDPRRLLNETMFGLPAAALADVSQRLGDMDPFLRLAHRLSLWFKSSRDLSRYGIVWQDGRAVRAAVLKLIERFDQEHANTTDACFVFGPAKKRSSAAMKALQESGQLFPSDPEVKCSAHSAF